ncbi:transmembrane protein 40 isoform X1 [Alexandromys fortis]|uniref:transmembrane protein 40 isoform X1 n=1 Tax=Alexandromys fortis TaxID=100897 RepID=UPI0021532D56|nr:transmembrane protein 40 isoform X1 [Microtus fortis]
MSLRVMTEMRGTPGNCRDLAACNGQERSCGMLEWGSRQEEADISQGKVPWIPWRENYLESFLSHLRVTGHRGESPWQGALANLALTLSFSFLGLRRRGSGSTGGEVEASELTRLNIKKDDEFFHFVLLCFAIGALLVCYHYYADWFMSLGVGLLTFASLETIGIYFGLVYRIHSVLQGFIPLLQKFRLPGFRRTD